MDEGRLGMVIRQEEQHRKYVYMMNDIIRARFSVYNNCLAHEQHESSVKLVKNCAEVRRSIVKQKVLRKCLEMRKRKISERDPSTTFGQYGGKPLWAMSRDIDRVIANNHPKIRRMKHVAEVMRQSLETGAILDEDAMSRRIEAFFQLKQVRQQKDKSPKRPKEVFNAPPQQRRNFFKPPSWAESSSGDVSMGNLPPINAPEKSVVQTDPSGKNKREGEITQEGRPGKENLPATDRSMKGLSDKENHTPVYSDAVNITSKVSLDVDSQGRLRGIITNETDDASGEKDELQSEEHKKTPSGTDGESNSRTRTGREHAEILTIGEAGKNGDSNADQKNQQYRASDDRTLSRSRSKLILPPIETSKALVSRPRHET